MDKLFNTLFRQKLILRMKNKYRTLSVLQNLPFFARNYGYVHKLILTPQSFFDREPYSVRSGNIV